MNLTENTYEIEVSEKHSLLFGFFSINPTDDKKVIQKVIQYIPLSGKYKGESVSNLGLGDFNIDTGQIDDEANTNNGDVYKVFNTVLKTIPLFFQNRPNHWLLVRGSDSSKAFVENCRASCRKNCIGICRNYNRRISIYCNYLDRHYDKLIPEYEILGALSDEKGEHFEKYTPKKKYIAVLLRKIKH